MSLNESKIKLGKVAPTPWKFEHNHISDAIFTPKTHKLKEGARDVYNVYDANGDQLVWVDTNNYEAMSLEGDDLAHAVHCVNLHDRLVKALEDCRDVLNPNESWNSEFAENAWLNARLALTEARKASGEAPDVLE